MASICSPDPCLEWPSLRIDWSRAISPLALSLSSSLLTPTHSSISVSSSRYFHISPSSLSLPLSPPLLCILRQLSSHHLPRSLPCGQSPSLLRNLSFPAHGSICFRRSFRLFLCPPPSSSPRLFFPTELSLTFCSV